MQHGSGSHLASLSSMGGSPADAAPMVVDTCSSKGAKGILGPSETENLVVRFKQVHVCSWHHYQQVETLDVQLMFSQPYNLQRGGHGLHNESNVVNRKNSYKVTG
jgi:hypothetical protein